jgi:hypothetical protein
LQQSALIQVQGIVENGDPISRPAEVFAGVGVEGGAGFEDQIIDELVCFRLDLEPLAADTTEGNHGLSVF